MPKQKEKESYLNYGHMIKKLTTSMFNNLNSTVETLQGYGDPIADVSEEGWNM
jgi:hypothetical protein